MNPGFNPAEAREGFKRNNLILLDGCIFSFNPAEAREGFKRNAGLDSPILWESSFNPAEAREGFKRHKMNLLYVLTLK